MGSRNELDWAGTMSMVEGQEYGVETVRLSDFAEALSKVAVFADVHPDQLCGLSEAELIHMPVNGTILDPEKPVRAYWVVFEGEVCADRIERDGSVTRIGVAKENETFGEVVLLAGKSPTVRILTTKPSVLLRFSEAAFWEMMACRPEIRRVVLMHMAQRLNAYQAEAAHREKLVSLGTLAAGLMHELHNPGSAAKRAASQLRANMLRLQELSLRFCDRENTEEQLRCMRHLQQEAITHARTEAMSSLEQSDAEEEMAEWLDSAGVENAYRIAPSLVGIGLNTQELECTRDAFESGGFSDAMNWLESLVSSVQLVDAIEESISRVSDLVMAVKKFAYDDRCTLRDVDVHDSIQSTLTILGHKLRQRQINVLKHFDAAQPNIHTTGVAISQVWTNLIDNAIDASPEGGTLEVRTWSEPGFLAVAIVDHGSGIAPEVQARIFEPFFTTKPSGQGTGLGLEIVQRIVTQSFRGKIQVDSKPGHTEFVVRLPQQTGAATA
jgi:signal transduction histidine kinase